MTSTLTIHTYGTVAAAAFIAGIGHKQKCEKSRNQPGPDLEHGLVVIFSASLERRSFCSFPIYILLSELSGDFSLSTLRSMGVYYGGLLLALASAAWFLAKKRLSFWTVGDLARRALLWDRPLVDWLSFGRLLLWQTDSFALGITFTNQYSYDNVGVPLNIPLHPTQIYEALGHSCYLRFSCGDCREAR